MRLSNGRLLYIHNTYNTIHATPRPTIVYCIVRIVYCIACIVLYVLWLFGMRCDTKTNYCVLYCIVLYCIVLYCVVLCCIVLYCIVVSWYAVLHKDQTTAWDVCVCVRHLEGCCNTHKKNTTQYNTIQYNTKQYSYTTPSGRLQWGLVCFDFFL